MQPRGQPVLSGECLLLVAQLPLDLGQPRAIRSPEPVMSCTMPYTLIGRPLVSRSESITERRYLIRPLIRARYVMSTGSPRPKLTTACWRIGSSSGSWVARDSSSLNGPSAGSRS